MKTNDATRATAEALPEISRRRFLLNTTIVGAAVAVAAPAVAAEPEMPPLEQAIWHMRELARLVSEDGGKKITVIAMGEYDAGPGKGQAKAMGSWVGGKIKNEDGMFAPKGGEA